MKDFTPMELVIWEEYMKDFTPRDLILCESPDGWSLHAPRSTHEQIASGDAPYLLCGKGSPPSDADYMKAFTRWLEKITPYEVQQAYQDLRRNK